MLGAFSLVALFCALAPLSWQAAGTEERAEYAPTPINQFIFDGLGFSLGTNRAEIITNLGTPERSLVRRVKNLHDPAKTDEVWTLVYAGLKIVIYRVSEDRREIITDVVITGTRYPMRGGLRIGSPIFELEKQLGQPARKGPNHVEYKSENSAPSQLRVYHKNGRITKAAWSFYVD